MSIVTTFDGYEIPGVEDWSEPDANRINSVIIPRRSGSLTDISPNLEERLITVKGTIVCDTAAALIAVMDALKAKLNGGTKQLMLHNDRFINAVKKSFDPRYISGCALTAATYQIQFACADPLWYAVTLTTETETITGSGTELFSYTPAGTAPSPVRFVFIPTGTLTNVKVYNSQILQNKFLQFDGSVSAGLQLIIDAATKTCTNAGANALSSLTGDFFSLAGGASNQLRITGSGHAGSMSLQYRAAWY